MSFFNLGLPKIDAGREYSLGEIPVFSSLSASEQKIIQKIARLEEYKRGDAVYEEGAQSDFFYVVISGRYRLFKRARSTQSEETLAFFYRGDHFGETSLLTSQPHSAAVEAKRDGLLLKLPREDFLRIVKEMPSISLHLSRSLGHRLTRHLDPTGKREVKIAVLYTQEMSDPAREFWVDFSARIVQEAKGKVALIDFAHFQDPILCQGIQSPIPVFDLASSDPSNEALLNRSLVPHTKGFDYMKVLTKDYKEAGDKKVTTLLTFLTYRYNFLLLRLPPDIYDISFRVLKKSDYVYVYAPVTRRTLDSYSDALKKFERDFGFSKSEIRLLGNDETTPDISVAEQERSLGNRMFWVLPIKAKSIDRYQAAVRYLARELVGTLLGLALGSGAAYGLAHIGVMKALEREGISPDIISGTSIGALIGAFWAAGYKSSQLEAIARGLDKRSAFLNLVGFRDLALFPKGFLKGDQVTRFLRSYLGDMTFQDLSIPLKIVTTDLLTYEAVTITSGSVVDAVRASISIPGIFSPVYHQGRYMLDGGVVDPLPVRVLSESGVKKIIAVNVLAGPKERIERNRYRIEMEEQKIQSGKKNIFARFLPPQSRKILMEQEVNIFNIIMSTIQFMEFEIANSWAKQADILIHPIVLKGHWAEFYAAEKFMRVGEEKTLEQIDEIKRLISE
ncbi:MAG: cyclic nucleotide-binding domain-containing protein [Candidatus Omnitrophica bacterium]|nr:cyclic nucleotide-binding domain-containing protein [Candidatus Omnitrophota bacterium]